MDAPPRLIVNQLVRDQRPEISGPLLEKSAAVSDQDLVEVISGGQTQSIRMIARRRSSVVGTVQRRHSHWRGLSHSHPGEESGRRDLARGLRPAQ